MSSIVDLLKRDASGLGERTFRQHRRRSWFSRIFTVEYEFPYNYRMNFVGARITY